MPAGANSFGMREDMEHIMAGGSRTCCGWGPSGPVFRAFAAPLGFQGVRRLRSPRVKKSRNRSMDKTPAPLSLAAARNLAWAPGRSAEAFIDGDLEVRFTPRPTKGPQVPHERDELYVVAAGKGRFR